MDMNAGANMWYVGWMDYVDRKETFSYHFSFLSITIGMGVIFLITNMVNKQIILQTKFVSLISKKEIIWGIIPLKGQFGEWLFMTPKILRNLN